MNPLWYAARANVVGIGGADLINWAHPERPQSWVAEVLVFDSSLVGSAGTLTMSSTTRHARGGLSLAFTTGAQGYARLIFGAQGDSGSIAVTGATAGGTLEFNAVIMQVTSTPTTATVTAW